MKTEAGTVLLTGEYWDISISEQSFGSQCPGIYSVNDSMNTCAIKWLLLNVSARFMVY